jgi:hypothetical protein
MNKREMQSELTRLRVQQLKARQDEMFGGFSSEEKTAYDTRANRIGELDAELEGNAVADEASAAQRRGWNKQAESDTPQSEAHQSYRNRERDSSRAFTDSLKNGQSKSASDKERSK